MERKNIYISVINTFIGLGVSLLFSGNLLIICLLILACGTWAWIERKFLFERVFRQNIKLACFGGVLAVSIIMLVVSFLTQNSRATRSIAKNTQTYLDALHDMKYDQAYQWLSSTSQQSYSKQSFINDHHANRVRPQDCLINKISLNEFDSNKANIEFSCPLGIYGQSDFSFAWIKEDSKWKLIANRRTLFDAPASAKSSEKKKSGVSNFFRSIF